jgi:hypothetical protein
MGLWSRGVHSKVKNPRGDGETIGDALSIILANYRGVGYRRAMMALIDRKGFGASLVGLLTFALAYSAGLADWTVIGVTLLVATVYYMSFG